jgi:TetR/AcrR family transcriptional repressor of nem operon
MVGRETGWVRLEDGPTLLGETAAAQTQLEEGAVTTEVGNTREKILATARLVAQARGYGGLSFRDLAREVGIKAASVHHYFPTKADLGVALARRYWEDSAANLEMLLVESSDSLAALRRYPETFRAALTNDNRLCMCSLMAAEYDQLPESVRKEVQNFADVNIAWLAKVIADASPVASEVAQSRAAMVFAAVAGAQLLARSRTDLALYDSLIDGYSAAGLLPA